MNKLLSIALFYLALCGIAVAAPPAAPGTSPPYFACGSGQFVNQLNGPANPGCGTPAGGGTGSGSDYIATVTSGGAGVNYVATPASGYARVDGVQMHFIPDVSSTAAPYLNDGGGLLPIYRYRGDGTYLQAGPCDVVGNVPLKVVYNATQAGGSWIITGLPLSVSANKSSSFNVDACAVSNGAALYHVTATATATLPLNTAVANGGLLDIIADGGDVTLASQGGDSINITSVKNGQHATLIPNGVNAWAVTIAGTPNGAGIPYHNANNTLSNSGTLTSGCPVIGGGTNGAPACGTASGNTTTFATIGAGTPTTGNCPTYDSNHNLSAAGINCSNSTFVPPVNYSAANGGWYSATQTTGIAGVGVMAQGTIRWWPYVFTKAVTISNIGAYVTTNGSSNCQFALYASNSAGLPTGTALATTGDVANNTTPINGAVNSNTPYSITTPGLYFFGANCNDSTVKLQAVAGNQIGYITGADTQAHLANSSTGNQTSMSTTQTYGTWPDMGAGVVCGSAPCVTFGVTAFWYAQFKLSSVP